MSIVVKPNQPHVRSQVIVDGEVVGHVVRYFIGWIFRPSIRIDDLFSPNDAKEIRRVADEAATCLNVTARLKGK